MYSETMDGELVSCIMATAGRPAFVRQAVRYFLRQTYRAAELVVVDDGVPPVADACAGLERVRYLRLDRRASTGAKLNLGIQAARGGLLQKWDDDDYYHPDFLRTAVAHMPPPPDRDHCLVAWDCFLILIAGERRLRASGHGWTIGNTFLFTRKFWARAPFRDLARGSDWWFLRDQQVVLVRVCAPEQCMVVRHGQNTWTDMRSGEPVDDYLRRFPFHDRPGCDVMGAEDWAFYESLEPGVSPAGGPHSRTTVTTP